SEAAGFGAEAGRLPGAHPRRDTPCLSCRAVCVGVGSPLLVSVRRASAGSGLRKHGPTDLG
uniref:Uncharacterized protein n=1 Tax=Accipiter nisus TaxID=211598 RepID=A0A8B9MXG0_9AVES